MVDPQEFGKTKAPSYAYVLDEIGTNRQHLLK
jgi:hypothetical protein